MLLKPQFSTQFGRFNHNWIPPRGDNTGIKMYNCITKSKETLIVKNKNFVSWYTCGPTVYDSAHVGHACCYVKLDIVQRILKNYHNLNLVTVMNITDIDDKLVMRSKALNLPVALIAKQYEKEFWDDLQRLGVEKPNFVIRVTENLDLIRDFITRLLEMKFAYKGQDNSIYFDVGKYNSYGKLIKINGGNYEKSMEKKNPMDFALWKSCKSDEMSFDSPWGPGRPGWHIECSALASHIFGSSIDIHSGGIDLKFPHHENEEAQSCALHSTPQWVNYWLHTGHLHLKDCVKMSKSLKNTLGIGKMLETTPPEVFRMACTMSHYRSPMEFTSEFMITASNTLRSYNNFTEACRNYALGLIHANVDQIVLEKLVSQCSETISGSLSDDFNTPLVIKALNELITPLNYMLNTSSTTACRNTNISSILAASNLVRTTLGFLGIVSNNPSEISDFTEVMNILNEFRQDVRQFGIRTKSSELLNLCDRIRNDVDQIGISIKDYGQKSSWSNKI